MQDHKIIPVAQPIVGLGSPVLRKACPEADQTPVNIQIVQDLLCTLKGLPNCAGIAAPQINASIQAFVMKDPSGFFNDTVVINPKIVKRRMTQNYREGCMSIPEVNEPVYGRDDIIDVEFYDENWNKVRQRLRGYKSIVFQHEYDHLHGILFIDRLKPETLEQVKEKLAEVERGAIKTIYPMQWPQPDWVDPYHKREVKSEG